VEKHGNKVVGIFWSCKGGRVRASERRESGIINRWKLENGVFEVEIIELQLLTITRFDLDMGISVWL
jgi:hypothetical protein